MACAGCGLVPCASRAGAGEREQSAPEQDLALATNSASTYLKQNSAMAGTFERNISAAAPAGEMSSVEILSPSSSSTGASSVAGTGSPSGTGLMLGPRITSPTPSGVTKPASEVAKRSGSVTGGSAPSVRGSVITPLTADAAATSDEQR